MKKLMILSAIILAGCAAVSETEAPQFNKAAMDTLLREAVSSGKHVGVSALIFDEGQTVYTGAFGQRDRERNQPVEFDTVFRIYSMTKPITSALILDLQEDELLNLDDPVAKYIPELGGMMVASADVDGKPVFMPQATPMTLKDLMLHRAGIGYGIFGPVNPVEELYAKAGLIEPTEALDVKMTKLAKLPLVAQPGEGWYYSYGIDVLGRVGEIVSGESLDELMTTRIFTPLGMTDTGFHVRPDQQSRFASNYKLQDDGSYILAEDGQSSPYLTQNAYHSGGGGLVSTLVDYAKFAQMILDGGVYKGHRVLDEATIKMMMSDQLDPDDKFMMSWMGNADEMGFGYGGSVRKTHTPEQLALDGQAKGQYSWGGMAQTKFWIDDAHDSFGIIMLQYFGEGIPDIHSQIRTLAVAQTKDAAE